MNTPLREQFVFVIMRFKRFEIIKPGACCLPQSELAVMAKASQGCACGEKGASTAEIQQDLPISKPAVSQTLNSLERKGYISRRIDPDDRRKITVLLTPAGEQVLAEARGSYQASVDDLLTQFGKENTQALIELLNRLLDILEDD